MSEMDIHRSLFTSKRRRIVLLTSLFLVLILIWIFAATGLVYQNAKAVKNLLNQGIAAAEEGDIDLARAKLKACQSELSQARRRFSITLPLQYIPVLGANLRAIKITLAAAQSLTQAADQIIAELVPNPPTDNLDLKKLLENLEGVTLENVNTDLTANLNSLRQADSMFLIKPVKDKLAEVTAYAATLQGVTNGLQEGKQILPKALGLKVPRRYLLLLQNDSELRPTGGTISSYGVMELQDGKIADLNISDASAIDQKNLTQQISPPEPLQKYWYEPQEFWRFSDSNFSPDFPSAAGQIQQFYDAGGGETAPDGIIALDSNLLSQLLKIIGPIKLADYPYEFRAENVAEKLQYHIEVNYQNLGLPKEKRKQIISDLGSELLKRTSNLPLTAQIKLIGTLSDALKEKHLLFLPEDPAARQLVDKYNWSGAIKDSPTDYLAIIDTNLGGWKSNRFLKRPISYHLEKDGNRLRATLEVTYQHLGDFDWQSSFYKTYTRIYVPRGSELITSEGGVPIETSEDLDKTVFAGFLTVEPKTTRQIKLVYLLPETIKPTDYSLLIQKQAGSGNYQTDIKLKLDRNLETAFLLAKDTEISL